MNFDREAIMKTPKFAVLTLAALSMLSTSGCKRHSNKEVYYLIASNLSLPYWQTAAEGFNKAAAEYQVTAMIAGPQQYNAQAELVELQKAIAAKPAGILISASDASVLQDGINAGIEAGIPIITFDSDAAGSRRLYFIGTNNLESGRIGGLRVIQKLGGRGNVVFFTLGGQSNVEERLKGFKEVFATRPDIHISDVVNIKGDARIAFDWTQESMALTGPKKIDAYVCLESSAGVMVADALKRANATDRELVAWDVSPATLDGIKSGMIDATIVQKPFSMGYIGLKSLDSLFHDKLKPLNRDYSASTFTPYPIFVDTGTSEVDKSNVDLYLAAAAEEQK
jgi:ribose transport system substrate-binding protein